MERWRESLTRRAPQVVAIIVRATDIHLGYTAPATNNLMHLLKEHSPWVPLFETKETNSLSLFFLQFMKLLNSQYIIQCGSITKYINRRRMDVS